MFPLSIFFTIPYLFSLLPYCIYRPSCLSPSLFSSLTFFLFCFPTDPPDPPLISGYPKGDILHEGEQRSLTCRVTGGNPRPWVLWYRHGRPLDPATAVTLQSLRADATISTKAPVSNVREEGSVSSVQQVVGSRHEDGAVYECRVTSPLLPRPLSTNVTLTVHCELPAAARRL